MKKDTANTSGGGGIGIFFLIVFILGLIGGVVYYLYKKYYKVEGNGSFMYDSDTTTGMDTVGLMDLPEPKAKKPAADETDESID